MRRYRKQFFEGKGKLEETRQGKYKRYCVLTDENLRLDDAMWARGNAYKKGERMLDLPSLTLYTIEIITLTSFLIGERVLLIRRQRRTGLPAGVRECEGTKES